MSYLLLSLLGWFEECKVVRLAWLQSFFVLPCKILFESYTQKKEVKHYVNINIVQLQPHNQSLFQEVGLVLNMVPIWRGFLVLLNTIMPTTGMEFASWNKYH